jgi:hypothetical protein
MQPPTTTPLDVQVLMPFMMPLISQFLNEASKLPPDERVPKIHRVLRDTTARCVFPGTEAGCELRGASGEFCVPSDRCQSRQISLLGRRGGASPSH